MKEKKEKTLYAAYGSNMNLRQMESRCPTAKVAGTALLHGYELVFGGVATVEPNPDGAVPMLIWSLEARDEEALDRYEGYPSFYRKEYHNVEVNGETVKVMIYIMNDGHEIDVPSRYYYEAISQGYLSAKFDMRPLVRALERSREEGI